MLIENDCDTYDDDDNYTEREKKTTLLLAILVGSL